MDARSGDTPRDGGRFGNVVRYLKLVGCVWAMLLSVHSVRRWSMRNRRSRNWPLRPMAKQQLLTAWEQRNPSLVPSRKELGGRVAPATRVALDAGAVHGVSTCWRGCAAMLRLEMAGGTDAR